MCFGQARASQSEARQRDGAEAAAETHEVLVELGQPRLPLVVDDEHAVDHRVRGADAQGDAPLMRPACPGAAAAGGLVAACGVGAAAIPHWDFSRAGSSQACLRR